MYVTVAVEFKLAVEHVPPLVAASKVTVKVDVPFERVAVGVAIEPLVVVVFHCAVIVVPSLALYVPPGL